jgi:hypothetical protein
MPYKLINPNVISVSKNKFKTIQNTDDKHVAAKSFFKDIIQNCENENSINFIITMQEINNSGKKIGEKTHVYLKRNALVNKKNNKLSKNEISIAVKDFIPGKTKLKQKKRALQGGCNTLQGGKRKSKKSRKSRRKRSSSSSSSTSEYLLNFNSNIIPSHYYLYNPFIYHDVLYSSYILDKNITIPNLFYNLSPFYLFPR